MGLETATTIATLNEANPLGTDPKSQGDDHIRMVKSVLKSDVMAASTIAAATEKSTPIDADSVGLVDSAASNARKKLTWANIKATLKTYFDTLYAKLGAIGSSGLTQSTARLLGRTTAATGAVEEISVGSGLSLSAGSLTCTVTSPVSSVGGYTGAVTAGNLLTAITTVDGAGSGLDADTLDGQHGSAYALLANIVSKDVGEGVGAIVVCYATVAVSAGATVSGSSIRRTSTNYVGGAWLPSGAAMSGTWRNIGATVDNDSYYISTFQRIA